MQSGLTGQKSANGVASRIGMAGLAAMLAVSLAACTTVEGGNAFTDFGTFEREVMTSTARGVGLVPGEAPKDEPTTARAPLVLPGAGQAPLPAPTQQVAAAQLPVNSDTVRIDTANLSEADMQRLRNARVVDINSLNGRALTEAEARQLTARLEAANINVTTTNNRPLYLPPVEYFTRVGDADLVCSIGNGEIVALDDARCPEEVRKAIQDARRRSTPSLSTGVSNSGAGVGFTQSERNQMSPD